MGVLTAASDSVYQYLNFDKVKDYTDMADTVKDAVLA
jgi:aconitate hydratase 2 / 2-methylisocitrate dehydratase